MFNKKTLKDIDLAGKRVLLRADYNVPVKYGVITNDYRIKESLPTIEHILSQEDASLVIISHLGRPEGRPSHENSLEPVAEHLSELLGKTVRFAPDCVGEPVKRVADQLKAGEILVLENLRFHESEEENSAEFAKEIVEATGADVFIQDGFGVVHRAHTSTDALAKILPSAAGLLLEKEVTAINKVMSDPERPLTAVVGGAKISDKIEILERLIDIADCLAIGGAMANNFLAATGIKIGKSLVEPESLERTKEIASKAAQAEANRRFNFLLPVDAVVCRSLDGKAPTRIVDFGAHAIADIEAYPKKPADSAFEVDSDELILDIGPISAARIAGAIKMSNTVIWNGTAGVTETKGIAGAHAPFAHGTHATIEAMIGPSRRHKSRPFTFVGGGDTVGFVEEQGLTAEFGHVSTGGGASLELMAGHDLPGISVLPDKQAA